MRYRELVAPLRPAKKLTEASLGFTYGYRSWYNPAERKWIAVAGNSSHVKAVMADPAAFGLTEDDLVGGTTKDRDPVVMNATCAKGWVRIAGANRQNPNYYIIFEAASLGLCMRVMKLFFLDMKGTLENATLKVRTADGGEEYPLRGVEQVKRACQRNELPTPELLDHNDSSKGSAAAA